MSPIITSRRAVVFIDGFDEPTHALQLALAQRLQSMVIAKITDLKHVSKNFPDYDHFFIGCSVTADELLPMIEGLESKVFVLYNDEEQFEHLGWRVGRITGNRLNHFHFYLDVERSYSDMIGRLIPKGG